VLFPDVPRAGFASRALATAIDAAVGLALSFLLSSSAGMFFARRAVVMLRIDDPASLWKGPVPLMLGTFGEVVYLLPLTLLTALSLDPVAGSTMGKRWLRLRVRDAHGAPLTSARSWRRFAAKTVGLSGCTLGLLAGRWEIALVASVAGLTILAGTVLALGPSSRTLHDRLSGTSVVRVRRG
jgi:uncharacterized RDD family membrane protein YckC